MNNRPTTKVTLLYLLNMDVQKLLNYWPEFDYSKSDTDSLESILDHLNLHKTLVIKFEKVGQGDFTSKPIFVILYCNTK